MPTIQTAEQFVVKLKTYQSKKELEKIQRYFKSDGENNQVIGIRMKRIFDLAKENTDMPLDEIGTLLESPYYEARMGAVSIMDFQTKRKSISEEQHKKLFDLYLNRHDRINTWDFVDRAAIRVIGKYLYDYDKPRTILYDLAKSENPWERRTAIVSTGYFLRKGETEDTFSIAKILLKDNDEFVQKAVGSWIRHAGKQNEQKLLDFLEKYAADMPRPMLNTAMEKLDNTKRKYFRNKSTV